MSPIRMSRVESGIRTVLAFNEALNRHDIEGMMRLINDDCVFESPDPAPEGSVYAGKEAITHYWQKFFRESPHAQIKIEDISGLGDQCVMRWRYNWTDIDDVEGYVRGVDIINVRDGFICEMLSYVKG